MAPPSQPQHLRIPLLAYINQYLTIYVDECGEVEYVVIKPFLYGKGLFSQCVMNVSE